METNTHYTLVGIFMITLISATIFAIIWLSSGFDSRLAYSSYKVLMKESVTGLNIDAAVEYNGVNVGSVTSIQINSKNPQVVDLLLKIKNDTPITQGTVARLGVRALTGIAYILLEDKGNDMRPLVASAHQPYPIINTAPSLLMRLDTAMTKLNDSFHQLADSIQTLLDKENIQSIKQILVSTQTTLQLLQTQTIPHTNQAVSNLGNVAHELAELSAEIKQNPSILIRGRMPEAVGPGE